MIHFSFMTFSTPELTLDENLALAQSLGYEGIEPRIEAGHRHGIELAATPAQRAAAGAKAAAAGIALCCVATSRTYADPAKTAEQIELTRRCIDLAGDVGAPRLRVFGGGLPKGLERAAAIELLAQSLRAVADQAAARGVTLCVETHDDWRDPNHLAQVMALVDHPAVGVNWDFAHPLIGHGLTPAESFETLKPWIRHAHIHDLARDAGGRWDLVWIGEGQIDHRAAVECLRSIAWEGWLSGEWIDRTPGYAEHLPRELATLKGY
jgi:sugar phosphate isomerase/epimerase